MAQSPEAIVRQFLAAWGEPHRDELATYLTTDAVWVDGAQGVRRGADAILDELTAQFEISRRWYGGHSQAPQIATLLADGDTVMVEWHGDGTIGSTRISTTVMAVFEVSDGRIKEMREVYDLQSILDQVQAAIKDPDQ